MVAIGLARSAALRRVAWRRSLLELIPMEDKSKKKKKKKKAEPSVASISVCGCVCV